MKKVTNKATNLEEIVIHTENLGTKKQITGNKKAKQKRPTNCKSILNETNNLLINDLEVQLAIMELESES